MILPTKPITEREALAHSVQRLKRALNTAMSDAHNAGVDIVVLPERAAVTGAPKLKITTNIPIEED